MTDKQIRERARMAKLKKSFFLLGTTAYEIIIHVVKIVLVLPPPLLLQLLKFVIQLLKLDRLLK